MSENHVEINDAVPLTPGRKVIAAAEANAWRDGYKFLADAEQKYTEEAKRGYLDGKAEGAGDAALLAAETAVEVDRYLASLEQKIAALALSIVRRIFSDFDNAELVAQATKTALLEFREEKAVTIKVHPDVKGAVAALITDCQAESEWPAMAIEIVADPDVAPQHCMLMTEFAMIEATVEAQLDAIARAMQIEDSSS